MIKIEFANLQDSKAMRSILEEHLVDIRDPEAVKNFKGDSFLIRNISADQMNDLIADQKNNLILVARQGDEILGYIISSRFSSVSKSYANAMIPYLEERAIDSDFVLYHRQIAVKSGTKNIGKALIAALLQEAENAGYEHIICKIIHQPLNNQKSIALHTKFGFNFIDELKEDVTSGLYICDLENSQNSNSILI